MAIVEKWKDIKDYKGLYQVSNLGRVRSVDHYASNGKTQILYRGKVKKLQPNKRNNYLSVILSKKDKEKRVYIHRLVAEAFIKKVDGKNEVNHIDGNKHNNTVENLEWVTSQENKEHAYKLGLYDTEKFRNRKRSREHGKR